MQYTLDTCLNTMKYTVIHTDTTLLHTYATDEKALKSYENHKRKLKKSRVAGVIINSIVELRAWTVQHELVDEFKDLLPFATYAVPVAYDQWPTVECVILTSRTQIGWFQQLADVVAFPAHIDGKFKVHHGKWMLMTVGTHTIKYCEKSKGIRHSFRPLLYMFVKQQESADSVHLLLDSCSTVSIKYARKPFKPTLGCADHGSGIMCGWERGMPGVPLAGCYAHISWKLSHGKLLSKCHPKHETICLDVYPTLRRCGTPKCFDLMAAALGREWGDEDAALNRLWDSTMCGDYANWFLGYDQKTPLAPPSNQCQESWHQNGVMKVLKKDLHGSTETVLTVTLPNIMGLDGALMPEKLNLEIKASWIQSGMYKKAKYNIDHRTVCALCRGRGACAHCLY